MGVTNYISATPLNGIYQMVSCCSIKLAKVAPIEDIVQVTMATEQDITSSFLESHHSVIAHRSHNMTCSFDDYVLLQSIGIGCYGLANIQLAKHKPSKQVVVVRNIDLETLDTDKLEEIQHEMKMSTLMCHRHIASYYCSFVCGSILWTVQTLMHYGSCADLMHSAKQFNAGFKESVIAIILRDIVKGLHYLHSLGYIHRSIKAKHFLIHESGIVKLSGMRAVISMIENGTRRKAVHGHFNGTGDNICWLAPEVLAQDLSGYTYKSDIYSVGIAALELATGEAPFAGLPLTEIMMLKLKGHPPMLLRRQDNEDPIKHFSKTFFKVVDICVDPNPQYRPNTTKLLSLSFLKSSRKKGGSLPASLKDLLLPVVPLNIDTLIYTPPDTTPTANTPIDPPFDALTLDEPWLI